MAKISIKNISKETQSIRPNPSAEKVELKPGETIVCDRDWAEANCLSGYGDLFREEGGANPEVKDVLTFIEKATDEEKNEIKKALGVEVKAKPEEPKKKEKKEEKKEEEKK